MQHIFFLGYAGYTICMQITHKNLNTFLAHVCLIYGCGSYFSSQDEPGSYSSTSEIVAPTYSIHQMKNLTDPNLPLSTKGQWIVNRSGKRLKLKSVNWYGASDAYHIVMGLDRAPIYTIIEQIKKIGFNSVRLPFSNEMLYQDNAVPSRHLLKNPNLFGKIPLQVFDEVITALSNHGLFVILNNHTTTAKWCCSGDDGNGLWVGEKQSSLKWMSDWEFLIDRYKYNPMVVGADLRNEIRDERNHQANWGKGGPFDFHRVTEELGNRLLAINPKLLIIVEGLHFSSNFSNYEHTPIQLIYPKRIVFSPHLYAWSTLPNGKRVGSYTNYSEFAGAIANMLKPLYKNGKPIAPIWFGEWGYSHVDLANAEHFPFFMHRFLTETGFDWAWWPLNVGPKPDSEDYESWGLLTDNWHSIKKDDLRLKKIKDLIQVQ